MAKDLAYNAEHDIHIASNLRLQGWKEAKMLVIGIISIAVCSIILITFFHLLSDDASKQVMA